MADPVKSHAHQLNEPLAASEAPTPPPPAVSNPPPTANPTPPSTLCNTRGVRAVDDGEENGMASAAAAVASPYYTVDTALRSIGFGKFQALMLAYSGMAYASEAMEAMLLSFVGPAVRTLWNLSAHEESLITSVVFAGMLLGAYTWGVVSDSYGRRMGFFFTALVSSGAGFLSAFAPNYISLIIIRFIVGISLGGGPVLCSWFLEFIPAPRRGTWMIIYSFFWTIGTITEASLAWIVMPTLGWRWLLGLSAVPSFLLLVFYYFTPESPRFLIMKGRTTEAVAVLEKMAKMNHKVLPSGMLVSACRSELAESVDHSGQTHLITIQKHETSVNGDMKSNVGGIRALYRILSPKLIRSTLLLWIVFFGNAFAYYGLVLLTSELSNKDSKCTSSEQHENHSKDVNLYKDVFITSLAEFPGLLLAAVMVDKVGRKRSVSAMLFISCFFLIPLIHHQKEVITTCLLFGARICITGSINISFIYAPEVYPTTVRTTGLGAASSMGRIGGILCPLVAVGLVEGCHRVPAIALFEVVICLTGLAVLFVPLETSGRELMDSAQSSKK